MQAALKTLGIIALVVVVVLGGAVLVASRIKATQDAEHAAFYDTGASVKSFVGDYGKAFHNTCESQDLNRIAMFFSPDYPGTDSQTPDGRAFRREVWVWEPQQTGDDISAYKLVTAKPWLQNSGEAVAAIAAYYGKLCSIEEIHSKIDLIERIADDHRDVVLRAKFIQDGVTRAGVIFQDRHFYRWRVRKFDDASKELPWLMEKYGEQLKFDVAEHSASGIVITDYNNDGWPDIFFADGVRSRLYRNDGVDADAELPTFTEVTNETGLDGIDQAQGGVFADVDNDGHQDLFVTRYLAPNRFGHNNGW